MARIGVLGLGLMGRPLARTLAASGHEVRCWNRSPLAPEVLAGLEPGPLHEAASSDFVLLMLYDTVAVGEMLTQIEPLLRPGQTVVDMSTSRPADSVERARRFEELRVGWVDAPVSGGPPAIEARTLAILVGGSEADVERVTPVLTAVGRVTHVGGPGAGHMVKLVNQTIVPLYIEAVAEGLALAERCGLDLALVREALRGGSADSHVFQIHGGRMARHDYRPAARAAVMAKDLRLIAELAGSVGLELPHATSTLRLYDELAARGEADLDAAALHKLLLDR
jgi:3-hydroxyisobutyrate dehydrogenase-like beta-hydroxyacid dehydrogenase